MCVSVCVCARAGAVAPLVRFFSSIKNVRTHFALPSKTNINIRRAKEIVATPAPDNSMWWRWRRSDDTLIKMMPLGYKQLRQRSFKRVPDFILFTLAPFGRLFPNDNFVHFLVSTGGAAGLLSC